jgi:hypothetical protein
MTLSSSFSQVRSLDKKIPNKQQWSQHSHLEHTKLEICVDAGVDVNSGVGADAINVIMKK